MKATKFMEKIEKYYGLKYLKGVQENLIKSYLQTKHENYLKCLFSAIVKNYTGEYKMLPNIAVFEKHIDATYDIIDEQKRKQQIQNLKTPAITDGDEVDYSEEMIDLFAGLDKKFKPRGE